MASIDLVSFISFYLGLNGIITLTVMVQFAYFKDFLVSVIGEQNYNYFVGSNDGKDVLNRVLILILVSILIGGILIVADFVYISYYNKNIIAVLMDILDKYGDESPQKNRRCL